MGEAFNIRRGLSGTASPRRRVGTHVSLEVTFNINCKVSLEVTEATSLRWGFAKGVSEPTLCF